MISPIPGMSETKRNKANHPDKLISCNRLTVRAIEGTIVIIMNAPSNNVPIPVSIARTIETRKITQYHRAKPQYSLRLERPLKLA